MFLLKPINCFYVLRDYIFCFIVVVTKHGIVGNGMLSWNMDIKSQVQLLIPHNEALLRLSVFLVDLSFGFLNHNSKYKERNAPRLIPSGEVPHISQKMFEIITQTHNKLMTPLDLILNEKEKERWRSKRGGAQCNGDTVYAPIRYLFTPS